MRSIDSSGTNIAIRDNDNELSSDFNPYAFPYFHSAAQTTVYDLIVRFARLWREEQHDLNLLVQKIQQRCASHPEEVQWQDSCGDTAMHRLCQAARLPARDMDKARYFADLGYSIIKANPMVSVTTNNWKETPLHQFVTHCGLPATKVPYDLELSDDCPIMTFFLMLNDNGAAHARNYWQSYALHDACGLRGVTDSHETISCPALQSLHCKMVTYLLEAAPQALIAPEDSNDASPVHRAVLGCGPHVVPLLVKRLLHQTPNFCRITLPLKPLLARYNGVVAILINAHLANHDDAGGIATQLGFLWSNAVLMCNAKVYGVTDVTDAQPLVHAMIQSECPPCCIMLAARLYPKDLWKYSTQGETVVTMALLAGSESWRSLLQENPSLAFMSNLKGQLPLHLASSITWKDGVKDLFAANPRALTTREPNTRLYPCMLYSRDLTTTFEMLRADPSVLLNSTLS